MDEQEIALRYVRDYLQALYEDACAKYGHWPFSFSALEGAYNKATKALGENKEIR